MIEEILKIIVDEKKKQGAGRAVLLNFLKEYLQYAVLSYIYNSKEFKNLLFKGGSCLRICFNLPRLSEDLDFDGEVNLSKLESFLKEKFKKTGYNFLETKIQGKGRLYLKFPILKKLGLTPRGESDRLFVKIEIEQDKIPYAEFGLTPVSGFGFNFLVRHYNLSALFTGKINAIIQRLWFKGKKNEVDLKGRDFYDLWWYLQKGIEPNWKALETTVKIKNKKELRKILRNRIRAVTPYKLSFDLQNFLTDREFVANFSENYKIIMEQFLSA